MRQRTAKNGPLDGIENRMMTDWKWIGNLRDDCTAIGHGMMLRAEMMDRANWWWAVYDSEDGYGEQIEASYDNPPHHAKTGKEARASAEAIATHVQTDQEKLK